MSWWRRWFAWTSVPWYSGLMLAHPLLQRIRELEQLLAADPDNVEVRQDLLRSQSRYLLLHGPHPEVNRAFTDNVEVLYALNPRDPLVSEVLAGEVDPEYRPPAPRDAVAELGLAAGVVALEQDDLVAAAEHLQAALLAEPDSPAVHLACARHALLRARPEEAWTHLEYALRLAPGCAAVMAAAGETLAALDRRDEAQSWLLQALSLNPLAGAAEQQLIALGFRVGYHWLKLPLRPAVWPLIGPDGRSWMVNAEGPPPMVRAAWRAWAEAIVQGCQSLAPDEAPLAGLPRQLPVLQHAFDQLLKQWRRGRLRRRLQRRQPAHPAALTLDWLTQVDADGLLEAYIFYGYLHPDLRASYLAWRASHPELMRQFLERHVMHPNASREAKP